MNELLIISHQKIEKQHSPFPINQIDGKLTYLSNEKHFVHNWVNPHDMN